MRKIRRHRFSSCSPARRASATASEEKGREREPCILPHAPTRPRAGGGGRAALTRKGRGRARETKFARADLSEVEADGSFCGYASLFGEADLNRDIVAPGAFLRSLARRGAAGIRMLFQHDPAAPIGVWEEVREDARGLFVRGRLMTEVAKGREVLALMRAGAVDGLSIGFRTIRGRTDAKTGVRRLLEVDLWEVSVVTFPMLPAARITRVKAAADARGVLAAIRLAAAAMREPPGARAADWRGRDRT
jgi:HK97 family phage prohead protease